MKIDRYVPQNLRQIQLEDYEPVHFAPSTRERLKCGLQRVASKNGCTSRGVRHLSTKMDLNNDRRNNQHCTIY